MLNYFRKPIYTTEKHVPIYESRSMKAKLEIENEKIGYTFHSHVTIYNFFATFWQFQINNKYECLVAHLIIYPS